MYFIICWWGSEKFFFFIEWLLAIDFGWIRICDFYASACGTLPAGVVYCASRICQSIELVGIVGISLLNWWSK